MASSVASALKADIPWLKTHKDEMAALVAECRRLRDISIRHDTREADQSQAKLMELWRTELAQLAARGQALNASQVDSVGGAVTNSGDTEGAVP